MYTYTCIIKVRINYSRSLDGLPNAIKLQSSSVKSICGVDTEETDEEASILHGFIPVYIYISTYKLVGGLSDWVPKKGGTGGSFCKTNLATMLVVMPLFYKKQSNTDLLVMRRQGVMSRHRLSRVIDLAYTILLMRNAFIAKSLTR